VALGAIIGRTVIASDQSLAVGIAALVAILAAHYLLTLVRLHPRVAGVVDCVPGSTPVGLRLTGLTTDVRAGLTYPVDLTFVRAGVLRLQLPVADPGGA